MSHSDYKKVTKQVYGKENKERGYKPRYKKFVKEVLFDEIDEYYMGRKGLDRH